VKIYLWIPGYERADSTAKAALCLSVTSLKLPACELIPRVSKFCLEEWQDIWSSAAATNCMRFTHCWHIMPQWPHLTSWKNRLKIGHSGLTHSYLLSGEDQPTCASCDAPLTVKQGLSGSTRIHIIVSFLFLFLFHLAFYDVVIVLNAVSTHA